jgi:transposase-like protein
MNLKSRVIFEVVDQETGKILSSEELISIGIERPKTIDQIGLETSAQQQLVQSTADKLIELQGALVNAHETCPRCQHKVIKGGKTSCEVHALNTDHEIKIQKYRCPVCHWASSDSIKTMYGTDVHTSLTKVQAELGSNYSHRKTETVLKLMAFEQKRAVNNRQRIKRVLDEVGEIIDSYNTADVSEAEITKAASALIVNVDGAHVATQEQEKRSFEVMAGTIYRPEDVQRINENENVIKHKICVASAREDQQASMKVMLVTAAKRAGMTKTTTITAFSDGAANCKAVINALAGHCGQLTAILDWFHIAMRFQNILSSPVLSDDLQEELKNAKWKLWHGKKEECCEKLNFIVPKIEDEKIKKKVLQLKQYLENNFDILVNYEERKNHKLTFTSNIAESTVENLVNSRCRQTGKMKWLREGVHALLQIRCANYCKSFNQIWEHVVPKLLPAMTI